MRANVQREEVEPRDGRGEHARLGVHPLPRVHGARAGVVRQSRVFIFPLVSHFVHLGDMLAFQATF